MMWPSKPVDSQPIPKRRKLFPTQPRTATVETAQRQATKISSSSTVAKQQNRTRKKPRSNKNVADLGRGSTLLQHMKNSGQRNSADSEPLLRIDTQASPSANVSKTCYNAEMDFHWMQLEKDEIFGPWFPDFSHIDFPNWQFSTLEEARVSAVKSYFKFAYRYNLKVTTVHMAAHNLGRMLASIQWNQNEFDHRSFEDAKVVSWRLAVKFNESPYHGQAPTDLLAINSHLGLGHRLEDSQLRAQLDKRFTYQEGRLMGAIGGLVWVPSALDFMDRLINIGAWPKNIIEDGGCRQLGHMLISIAFLSSSAFCDVVPSQLAAAALALSVKIINIDIRPLMYEYHPECVAKYLNATYDDLKPIVSKLAKMLRCKPNEAKVLESWYPFWANTPFN
eukprot:Selendium_serpulae@DN1166_c0_g1_i1.p1